MGSKKQPGFMRAQKRGIQIIRVIAIVQKFNFYLKKNSLLVFIWNWKSFLQ
jgi:hypothetical protein